MGVLSDLVGTTHAPSFQSTCARAGWSLGAVLGRYFKYESSMDCFLGRVLAGLDVSSPQFAVLPPHFAHDQVSNAIIFRCFPGFRERPEFAGVLRCVLPSLVFHYKTLAVMLPRKHRLHSSVLFQDKEVRLFLDSVTVSGLDSPYMRASGIPPHIVALRQGTGIESRIMELTDALRGHNLPGVRLPEREQQEGQNNEALVDGGEVGEEPKPILSPSGFPLSLELPLVGPLAAWRLLVRGNKSEGLPPFRHLQPFEFGARRDFRKRISDWLFFFKTVVTALGGLDDDTLQRLERDDDEGELTVLYKRAWASFAFGTGTKSRTRPDQWTLNTVVQKLRLKIKAENAPDGQLPPPKPRAKKTPTVVIDEGKDDPMDVLPLVPHQEPENEPRQLYSAPRKRSPAVAALMEESEDTDGRDAAKVRRVSDGIRKKTKGTKGKCDYSALL